ncbi:DUF3006 domain-containing protein [Halorubrum vacuolatum]|uniref:DUF3006 domain-containing protein n=1 Tax=Halorubrum vacuolatum TaxID=63740 RepID=A0A238VJF7_HALVU|nr:DUF3006 domain-containing protein [Halorubrum vacuolatum]SNR34530.1 Protein of unknown function [Halorubrum vacuolatum]
MSTYTAVVDRIVDGETAVLLLEEVDEHDTQLDLPVERLPANAQRDGAVLTVTLVDGTVTSIQHEQAKTQKRREAAQKRLDRLSMPLRERDQENADDAAEHDS